MSFKLILVNPIPKNWQMMGLYMLPSLTPLRFEPTDYHLNIIIISILQDFATKSLEIAEETFENQQVCILVPQKRDIATRNTFRSSFENNVFDNSASCDHSYKKNVMVVTHACRVVRCMFMANGNIWDACQCLHANSTRACAI